VASARTRLLLLALIPAVVVAGLWLVAAVRPPEDPRAAVELSGPMPEIDGPALLGGEVTPAGYRGKAVVVNFWASWCGPCRREQPGLQRLSEEYEGRVEFIGVNFKDDPAAARAYLGEFGVTYPSVQDRTGKIAHQFQVPWLPATVLSDGGGELRYRLLGAQAESTLRGYLEELIGSST
jgi:thiol-disulfide isomerase/thioredoxin